MRRLLATFTLVAASAHAMGPLEKNHPLVDEGMEAFERGDYERALQKFTAAAGDKELSNNPTVELNRGVTLHKLGQHDEAIKALNNALALDKKGELAESIHYNLGNVQAALDHKKEAIAEYRRALRLDPKDGQARHNLEVLLRDLPPPQSSAGPDGGTPDGGKSDAGQSDGGSPDAGRDGGSDAGRPGDGGAGDAGNGDGGSDGGADGGKGNGDGGSDGGRGDGGNGEGDKRGDGGQQGDQKSDGGADGGEEQGDGGTEAEAGDARDGGASLSKSEAEKLLDSMKNSEKNLQLWRFQQKRSKRANGKDW